MPKFSKRSQDRLDTCAPDLIRLFNRVIEHYDCTVLEGYRNQERQEAAYAIGASKVHYPKSKHNSQPSMAVDVCFYPIEWTNRNEFYHFAGFVKATAISLGIKVKWGGDFSSFFDGPHWELI